MWIPYCRFQLINYTSLFCLISEMRPKWFPISEIPYDDMWPDDILWFPFLFSGQKFSGYFKFNEHSEILDYSLQPAFT